ncbi:MAG: aspartyl protease family protein [Marinicella sp.]
MKKLMTAFMALSIGFLVSMPAQTAEHESSDVNKSGEILPAALGDFNFSGEELILKTTHKGPHPRVIVDLGDGEEYKFIVDTGASVNVMDSAIAKRLGYEVIGETKAGPPGGPQVDMNIVKVPEAAVGDGQIRGAEFLLMDIQGFSRGSMHGILGMALFREYLLTFDLSQGQITLAKKQLTLADEGVYAYEDNSGHIMINMDVAGTIIPAHIDTGAMGAIMLPGEALLDLPIIGEATAGPKARLVGGQRDIQRAKIDGSIKFGGFEFDNQTVSFMTPSTGYGNIGGVIFSQMVMSIDQQNHLIGFFKPKQAAKADSAEPRRLGIEFRGMGGMGEMSIGLVESGSLGEAAGFKTGDHLLSLNGVNMKDMDLQDVGALIRGTEQLLFVVDRDGQQVTLEVN